MDMYERLALDMLTVKQKEDTINYLTQKLIQEENRRMRPLFPWVQVRVLQKEGKIGSIVTPDFEQNKTVHEGIVIATWAPFTRSVTKTDANGNQFQRAVEFRSQFELGDHVLFPHWAGAPLYGLSEKYYRTVKEMEWEPSKDGGIFAVIDYDSGNTKPVEKLRKLLRDELSSNNELPEVAWQSLLAEKISAQFLLVDRTALSVTVSGRGSGS